MYSLTFLAIATVLIMNADACTKRRRPPPPTPQPPNAPPPPDLPPVVIKTVRQQEQHVGFNKCYRHCDGGLVPIDAQGEVIESNESGSCEPADSEAQNGYDFILESGEDNYGDSGATDANGNPCLSQTNCHYRCKMDVFVEVALETISTPTNCGCAFHVNMVNPRPATVMTTKVESQYVASSIEISDMHLAVFDWKQNREIEMVPGFKLAKHGAATEAIKSQLKEYNQADFTTATQAFAGQVVAFPELPESLDLNNPDNQNNVPALKFSITQTYNDIKLWKAPVKPQMEQMPNAYQSQCVRFYPENPFCYNSRKRNGACSEQAGDVKLYHKRFLLFPKLSKIAENLGDIYASRMITSFYLDDECTVEKGVFSIDSEFKGDLAATSGGASLALGTWSWQRQFADGANGDKFGTLYIRGVPGLFATMETVFDKGYSSIQWHAFSGFTHGTDGEHDIVDMGICQSFAPVNAPFKRDKYDEAALFYKPESTIKCSPFDDVVRDTTCGTQSTPDLSLMAFLNEGSVLNFNKEPTSTLIMGRMDQACRTTPYAEVVFDTLTFSGCPPGQVPKTKTQDRKRANHHDDIPELGLIYDDEKEGYVHFLHKDAHAVQQLPHKRSLAQALQKQIASPPNEENHDMRVAAGSVDEEGGTSAHAGDHPMDLFPETFSSPINIDPDVNSPEVVTALVTTGSEIPNCNRGSIGCSCRANGAECDLGLSCDQATATCLLKNCVAGEPGCPCLGDGSCADESTECAGRVCKIKPSCAAGTAGCHCDKNSCSDGSSCAEGLCVANASTCSEGDGGCLCAANDECADGFECNSNVGLCAAPRCTPGEPGCACKADTTCEAGFECDSKHNVCGLFHCEAGKPGCLCTEQGKCTTANFKCVLLDTNGESRCIAEATPTCSHSLERCIEACGTADNINICPPCSNSKVYCKAYVGKFDPCEADPFSEACPASTILMALSSVMAAVFAFMF